MNKKMKICTLFQDENIGRGNSVVATCKASGIKLPDFKSDFLPFSRSYYGLQQVI